MEDDQFPAVDEALVRRLEELYPDRFPDTQLSDVEMAEKRGAIKLVRFLRSEMELQQQSRIIKR